MDPLLIFVALAFGLGARQISLPPMAGFLVAGFALHMMGAQSSDGLRVLSDFGVILLLFTIGLKLRLRSLLAPQVWAVGGLHMAIYISIVTFALMLPGIAGLTWLGSISWASAAVIAFALSFSSTIFAVKILEDRGEMKTRHGQITIGILIIQDIVAVIFLTLATGKLPSLWAIGLLALPLLRPVFNSLMNRSGHGEVLILYGMFMAIGGGELFELVGLKAGLGALIFGLLLGGQTKTSELAAGLLRFKDLFLVSFFLSIGLGGLPNSTDLAIATGIVVLLLPVKSFFYFVLMAVFRLRARTAFLSSNDLSNFSEFGLIVAAVAVSAGWMSAQWFTILAVSLALSFVAAAIFNTQIHTLYEYFERYFHRFETRERLAQDRPPELGDAEILILGMGRVGRGAYQVMNEAFPGKVCGIDADAERVIDYQGQEVCVITGDAEDVDFWHGIDVRKLRLIMLAMPTLSDMTQAIKLIDATEYQGRVAAVSKYEDDQAVLEKLGVNDIFNIYAEAGAGFAEHVRKQLPEHG